MEAQVVSINTKVESITNAAMAKRFDKKARMLSDYRASLVHMMMDLREIDGVSNIKIEALRANLLDAHLECIEAAKQYRRIL